MKLYTICQSCKEEVKIRSMASTRPDLEMEKGETFEINCKKCGLRHNVHVNDVKAKENNTTIIGGIGLSVIVTAILWNFFGAISTISGIIPILIWRQQSSSLHAFNSYRRGRR
jgi:hypothetical protein